MLGREHYDHFLALCVLWGDTMGNARARIAESLGESQALAGEIDAWYGRWGESGALSKHWTQLDLLAGVTHALIDILSSDIAAIDPAGGIGWVYEECRRSDERLLYVRRLWRYYADKFDQRAGPDEDPMTRTLRAADEVIWSCWKTALKNLGGVPEFHMPVPLAYLAPQFTASATRCAPLPADLGRLQADKVLDEHVKRLPIPVIALPPVCQRRPWWLVVAAHEVGHQVQWAFPELKDRAEEAISVAVGDDSWRPWQAELFADAFAVLLTGPAIIWAITELETRPEAALRVSPHPCYPPPLVRIAVARAVADKVGLPDSLAPEQNVTDLAASHPGDGDLSQLLGRVPLVADALLGLTTDGGRKLHGLAASTGRAFDGSVINYWRDVLPSSDLLVAQKNLDAARFCVAGSVAAWQSLAIRDTSEQELADDTAFLAKRVRAVLPDCAEPGTRRLPGIDVVATAADLARQFAADLHATDLFADADLLAGAGGAEVAGGALQP
jgi:hypothetical protein